MKISDPKKLKLLTVLKDYAAIFHENKRLSWVQVREVTGRVYSRSWTSKESAIRMYIIHNYSKIKEMLKEQNAQPTEHRHCDSYQETAHQEFTLGGVTTIADHIPEETVHPLAQGQPEHVIDADKNFSNDKTLCQLYTKVINHLPRQTVDILLDKLRTVHFDSEEKLQSVVDLVYEQAITEPSLIPKYATMCKQLALMRVSFRKLIKMRCERELENNFMDTKACADLTKKKEIQLACIGHTKVLLSLIGEHFWVPPMSYRFIAELFKQEMLTINIMHRCISHFLARKDEESLECLCKLLRITGSNLESKGQNLDPYVKQMLDIVSGRVPTAVSPRVRFMVQDIVELKMSKWIPGEDNGKYLDTQFDNPLMNSSSNVSTDAQRTVTLYELRNNPINTIPGANKKRKRDSDDDDNGVGASKTLVQQSKEY